MRPSLCAVRATLESTEGLRPRTYIDYRLAQHVELLLVDMAPHRKNVRSMMSALIHRLNCLRLVQKHGCLDRLFYDADGCYNMPRITPLRNSS